jgi:hypothetical protein
MASPPVVENVLKSDGWRDKYRVKRRDPDTVDPVIAL